MLIEKKFVVKLSGLEVWEALEQFVREKYNADIGPEKNVQFLTVTVDADRISDVDCRDDEAHSPAAVLTFVEE